MLLVLDVGNTNIVLGVFEGQQLKHRWRVVTRRDRTTDEFFIVLSELLDLAGFSTDQIDGVSISSVVPPLLSTLLELSERCFKVTPLVVGPGIKTGMPIHVDNPREVGADRIVNAVAAHARLGRSALVIDFGTATKFDVIGPQGSFEGGAIAPGLAISTEALFKAASKLPRVEMTAPRRVIGKNTVAAMQSGIVYGYAGMVDSMVARMKEEMKREWPGESASPVIATGGLVRLLEPALTSIDEIDEDLTLQGLQIIHQMNREE